MPYIGRGPVKSGAFRILDDVSGSFNGSTTSFALTVGNTALTIGLPETLLISITGVIHEAGTAFTISGSNIVFTSAPAANVTFWGVELGDVGGVAATVSANTVDTSQLVADAVTYVKMQDLVTADRVLGSTSTGVIGEVQIVADMIATDAVTTAKIANDQVTGAKLNPALVAGDIIYADGTDTITKLAKPGTPAGEVLTFAASATAPSWAAATSTFIGVRVENSSSQSIGNNSAIIIVFDADVTQFDTDTMHSSSADTKITFTTAGKYWVGLSYAWAGNSTGRRNIWVSKNNSATIFRQTILPSTADEAHDGFGFIYEFAAADYIYFYGHQTSGGALNLVADNESATVAMAYKIG